MTIYHSCVNGDYSSTVITIAVFLLIGSVFLNIFVLIDWLIDWFIELKILGYLRKNPNGG